MRTPRPAAERYHAKVDKRGPTDCWPWLASTNKKGYGKFGDGTTVTSAHRFGYVLLVGPIPQGLCVLHTCDNPPCQNPAHWFLGTNKDNVDDRERKRRRIAPQGEQHGRARLTEEQVHAIRQLYAADTSQRTLARTFSVSQRQIGRILQGVSWSHSATAAVPTRNRNAAKLTEAAVRRIRCRYQNGETQQVLAADFAVTRECISSIIRRRTWGHVRD